MREINSNTILVSAQGGILDVLDQGEVVASIAVPPGRVRAAQYLDLIPEGTELEIAEGLVAFHPRSGVSVTPPEAGMLYASAANPDFQVTSASRLEQQMRLAVDRMNAASDRIERRERALSTIERIPRLPPAHEDVAVIEDGPTLEVEIKK